MSSERLNDSQVQAQILKQLKRTNRFLGVFAGVAAVGFISVIVLIVMMVQLIRTTVESVQSLPDQAGDAATEQVCEGPLNSIIGNSEFCQ